MNEGITSELVIESIDRSDSALYQCITSNAYGRDETSIQVIVQGIDSLLTFHKIIINGS